MVRPDNEWIKTHESKDCVRFSKKSQGMNIYIEAREKKDKVWEVVIKYAGDGISHFESYNFTSRSEALSRMSSLKKEALDKNSVLDAQKLKNREVKVKLKRSFKDYSIEKWTFSVDGDDFENFIYVLFEESVTMDVVMKGSYRLLTDRILNELTTIFSLDESDVNLKLNVYYYEKCLHKESGSEDRGFLKLFEIGFRE